MQGVEHTLSYVRHPNLGAILLHNALCPTSLAGTTNETACSSALQMNLPPGYFCCCYHHK